PGGGHASRGFHERRRVAFADRAGRLAVAMPLPLPDPPLADDAGRMRPWGANDVGALVDAWSDEEIQRWTRVPERRGEPDALRWIAAEGLRRERGLALDLVISPADQHDATVLGEVGMVPLAGGPS